MRERPILFSGPMVHAILKGRKTQTRRVVRNPERLEGLMLDGEAGEWCPLGNIGDRLWVRETFAIVPRTAYAQSEGVQQTLRPDDPYDHDAAIYREGWERSQGGLRWKPSIFMPRWASRITLEIKGVRVERVQEIDELGALDEGTPEEYFETVSGTMFTSDGKEEHRDDWIVGTARDAYRVLWDSLNAKRGYSWDSNPWVWVIEFKRLEDAKAAA